MSHLSKIMNVIGENWAIDTSNLQPKKNTTPEVKKAVEVIKNQQKQVEADDLLLDFGFGAISLFSNFMENTATKILEKATEVDEYLDEYLGAPHCENNTKEIKKSKSEDLKDGLSVYFKQLEEMKKSENNYNLIEVCDTLTEYLTKYKNEINAEFEITDELGKIDEVISNINEIKSELDEIKKENERENTLGKALENWANTMGTLKDQALEQLDSMTRQLSAEQNQFLEDLKAEITGLFPAENNGSLFSEQELESLRAIKSKCTNKIKLSEDEVKDLLKFTDRENKLQQDVLKIIKNKFLYEHSFITKNFVSLLGASLAGMVGGPGAAFAAHHYIGSVWENYVSAKGPNNRIEQLAMLMMNGVVGNATGGIGGAIACTAAQVVQDEAPTEVKNTIAAASLAYLAHLTGASPSVSLKVGLLGLLVLKGRQIFQAVKSDLKAIGQTIKKPLSIPRKIIGAITKIATDVFSAIKEKKWAENFSNGSAVVISLALLITGSSTGVGLIAALMGIYLSNRIHHSEDSYTGEATLANEDFCKWAARQHQLAEKVEDQVELLNKILAEAMGKTSDEYKETAQAVKKLMEETQLIA